MFLNVASWVRLATSDGFLSSHLKSSSTVVVSATPPISAHFILTSSAWTSADGPSPDTFGGSIDRDELPSRLTSPSDVLKLANVVLSRLSLTACVASLEPVVV